MNIQHVLKDIGFSEFISIDLETTGLNKDKDEIIEVSAIKFINGQVDSDFTTLINPKIEIPKQITALTRISNKMVSNAPFIEDILDDLILFIDGSIVIAHNIEFDLGFINKIVKSHSKKLNTKAVCDTLLLSRSFLFTLEKFNLEYLSSYFNLKHNNAHRAQEDALNTGKIFVELINQMLSMPIDIFSQINQLCKQKNVFNQYLYERVFNFLKSLKKHEFESVLDFDLRGNVLDNSISQNDDFSDISSGLFWIAK